MTNSPWWLDEPNQSPLKWWSLSKPYRMITDGGIRVMPSNTRTRPAEPLPANFPVGWKLACCPACFRPYWVAPHNLDKELPLCACAGQSRDTRVEYLPAEVSDAIVGAILLGGNPAGEVIWQQYREEQAAKLFVASMKRLNGKAL